NPGVRAGFALALAAVAAGAALAQQTGTSQPPPLPPTTPTETGPTVPPFATPPGATPRPRDPLLIDQIRARPNALTPAEAGRIGTPADERDRVILENADVVHGKESDGITIAEGHVQLRYNGYHVTCDRATWDRRKRIVTCESHVTLVAGQQTVYAEYVR